jgi:hypothetical protein
MAPACKDRGHPPALPCGLPHVDGVDTSVQQEEAAPAEAVLNGICRHSELEQLGPSHNAMLPFSQRKDLPK